MSHYDVKLHFRFHKFIILLLREVFTRGVCVLWPLAVGPDATRAEAVLQMAPSVFMDGVEAESWLE